MPHAAARVRPAPFVGASLAPFALFAPSVTAPWVRALALGLGAALALPAGVARAQAGDPAAAPAPDAPPRVTVTGGRVDPDTLPAAARPAGVGKSDVPVQDTPFAISVVDADEARQAGARSVQDALLYTGGVYSGRYGFDTRGDWSAVRGLTPSAYIDGLRGLYGFYNTVRPEIWALERIEVLKGPSSALFGQGDLGGIVNAVSKRPQARAAREVEVQVGSHDRRQVAADLTGPVDDEGRLLYRLVALRRVSGTAVDHVDDDALLFQPSLTWRPDADTTVTAMFVHQANDSQVSAQFLPIRGTLEDAPLGRIPTSRFVGEPGWDRYDTRKNELSLFADRRLGGGWSAAVAMRQTNSSSVTREHWTTVGAVPDDLGNMPRTIYAADRKTDVFGIDLRLQGELRLGPTQHRVALGVDHQNALWEEFNYAYDATGGGVINLYAPVYGNLNAAALSFSDRPDNAIEQTGLYLMDHVAWGPWVVSAALRHDRARNRVLNPGDTADTAARTGATTGRLGLMYRFDNGVSPYAAISSAFSPNLGTDGTAQARNLRPTTGTQREAGVKLLSASGDTQAAVAAFQITQRNRIADGSTPGGVTQVGAEIRGFEAELRQRLGPLQFTAAFTRLDPRNAATGQPLSSVPERTASAWLRAALGGGWQVGAGARHVGAVYGAGAAPRVPSVTLIDAMVGYEAGPVDLRLNVQNAADEVYVSWCRGAGLDCGWGERRAVVLTAATRF